MNETFAEKVDRLKNAIDKHADASRIAYKVMHRHLNNGDIAAASEALVAYKRHVMNKATAEYELAMTRHSEFFQI